MNLAFSSALALRSARKAKRKAKAKKLGRKPTRAALVRKADTLFSELIRKIGHCQSDRENHSGVLQCAHGFSRRYHAVRWNRNNAFCLCAGCHIYFTHRPIEWDRWMRVTLPPLAYEKLWSLALSSEKPDMNEVIASLQLDLKEFEI